jgi:hypothetical protein
MRGCKNSTIEVQLKSKDKKTGENIIIKIDRHDLVLIEDYYLGVVYTKGVPYVCIREHSRGGMRMLLSRYLIDLTKKNKTTFAVHINGDRFDFRRSNLTTITAGERRITSLGKINRKQKLPRGVYIGTILANGTITYRARFITKSLEIHLGTFMTPDEAHLVYMDHRNKYLEELRASH